MRLLFVTQVMDRNDGVLGAYHDWVAALAPRFDHIHALCLFEGEHALPGNVTVHSLGKDKEVASRYVYAIRFLRLAWQLRHEYDTVFVHMNQEYILLTGLLWKFLRKPIYFWRNHYAGSWLTNLAVMFSAKVFCTSTHSYTARFKKTVLMPVGIDFDSFYTEDLTTRQPGTILFLARIASSKRVEVLIDALRQLHSEGIFFTASIVGSPLPKDQGYYDSLQRRVESHGLSDSVTFLPGVPHHQTPAIYQAHDIFVNCSPSGMFDKTLFEAAAAGCRVLAASDDFHLVAGDESYAPDSKTLAARLIDALSQDGDVVLRRRHTLQALARQESLPALCSELVSHLSQRGREE